MKKIKWGVLGYAWIAKNEVIPAIINAPNSEFYAMASRDNEKLKECIERFGVRKVFKSYDELLDCSEVEAVYIPLPNALHKEWTVKAARKGKHVLCEKPIALNADECLQMRKECDNNGVKLMEAFMYRYSDRIRKLRELLDSEAIGEVKYINSSIRIFMDNSGNIRYDPHRGGGALYDLGSYAVNFAGMVTGCTPVSMSGECLLQNGIDTIFSAVLKYENGVIGTVSCGFNAFGRAFTEIVGTKGVIEIPNTFSGIAGVINVTTETGSRQIKVKETNNFVLEVKDFADAVINDRQPMFGMDETLRNIKIVEQLQEMVYRK